MKNATTLQQMIKKLKKFLLNQKNLKKINLKSQSKKTLKRYLKNQKMKTTMKI
jgi:hypothetical protein